MVNNSTNINKHHLSLQLIEWWSTIPPQISTKITPLFNSLSDGQQFHQYQQKSPLTSIHWVMVNNSTNINKNHLSPQFIEWWSTIPPISTTIISHFNSLSDGQQFHQYQQKSPLTSTHWVMVNNSTNINKNHLSLQLIEWWSTIPPISTKITSHLNSLNDGQQFHQYQQKSPLTSTHWVMVNNSTNINKNHLSPNTLSDGQQFHQYQQKSLLTSIHWVMSIITPISTKITSHFNSLNDGQQFHQYQQKSPLTSIHWVMVNNSTNINKNHLSPQYIEIDGQQFHQYQQKSPLTSTHWVTSTIPPISTKITSHLYTLSDGQQFHQYQQKSPLTSIHWEMVNNFTNFNKNHLSPQYIEWWSTISLISTTIISHFNSLSDGQQFH